MLGTNKTSTIQRLTDGAYVASCADIQCRYSPIKTSSEKGYVTKAMHIISEFRCDQADIIVSDRIVIECEAKTFVVVASRKYDDATGKHMAIFIREVGSTMHEDVVHKTVSSEQPAFDPIFQEWVDDNKSYEDVTVSVLLDPFESAKASFIKILEAGKLEDVDWIMTVDFPTTVDKADKFVFNDTNYDVKWIVPHPFQRLVGLKKSLKDYSSS